MNTFLSNIVRFCCVALFSGFSVGAAERVRIVETPHQGVVPDAEIDAQGIVHVAYVSGSDAYYAYSSDEGKTFSSPLRINSEPGTVAGAMFRGPDIAAGKNGRIHVIWYVNSYQKKLPPDQWGVFHAHLDLGQNSFSKARNLNHKPSDNYSLAATDSGEVAVVWTAGKIYLNSSLDNGETFSEAETVQGADPCECCATRSFFSPQGTLFIDYREKANNIRDMHLLARPRGQRQFRREKISSTPWPIQACPMTGTFLTGQSKGLLIAWETKGSIYYTRTGPSGESPKEIHAADRGKYPLALAAPDGTVLVSWKEGSMLCWQLHDRNDRPLGEINTRSSRNADRHAGVVTPAGNFVLFN